MTDQQRLRDALETAVPEPPPGPWQGSDARALAHRTRRHRITVGAGVVATVMVAGLAIWVSDRPDPGPTVTGSGAAACHRLAHAVHAERVDDVRVVDGSTAATWLSQVAPQLDPASYRHDDRVTVCFTAGRPDDAIYVVPETGRFALVKSGPFNAKGGIVSVMTALERTRTGGRETTDEPFTCPTRSTHDALDVTSTLPKGATQALLCSDGGFFIPSQPLTSGVDRLVRAINATGLGYTPPDFTCSPYAGAYDYTIVFRYPTGTRSATWDPCRGMLLGSFSRSGPLRLDQTYLSLLAAQVGTEPGSSTPPPCSSATAGGPEGVGDLRHLVAARYCPDRAGAAGTALNGQQLGALRSWGHSLTAGESVPEHTCAPPATGWPRLVLADTWGNRFSMVIEGCGRRLFPGVVDPGAPHRVAHPEGSRGPFLRVARQLAAG